MSVCLDDFLAAQERRFRRLKAASACVFAGLVVLVANFSGCT